MGDLGSPAKDQNSAEYAEDLIFRELDTCISAFEILSDLASSFVSVTRPFVGNLDCYFFDSLEGTVESIRTVLLAGRFADAYALLRRFNETGLVQLNVAVKLEARRDAFAVILSDDAHIDSPKFHKALGEALEHGLSVDEIDKWIVGEKGLKTDRPSRSGSATIDPVHSLFESGDFEEVLDRCNHHVHINFLRNLRANARIGQRDKMAVLNQFARDFRFLFARYAAYTFTLHPVYLGSSDYVDALECGLTPAEESQLWVAPIVQELFDVVVTPYHPHVTDFLRTTTGMELMSIPAPLSGA